MEIKKHSEDTELLIELLVGALQEEGYEVVRFSDTKIHYTTSYDALKIKRHDGIQFTIDIEEV